MQYSKILRPLLKTSIYFIIFVIIIVLLWYDTVEAFLRGLKTKFKFEILQH